MISQHLLDKIIAIAQKAGEAVMGIYDSGDFDVSRKGDDSPLTKADLASHDVILSELTKVSDYPIISEENDHDQSNAPKPSHLDAVLGISEERTNRINDTESERESVNDTAQRQELQRVSGSAREQAEAVRRFWLVDPLDGTKEFIKRRGEFTVNIALIGDGEPVLGVVFAPAIGMLYAGSQDVGAFKMKDGKKRSIKAVFGKGTPKIVTSKSHRTPETDDFLAKIGKHKEVSIGSSLKLCLVAEGEAMLYPRLGPTYGWDTAAGDAVVRAAGGSVTDLKDEPLVYLPKVAKNPDFVAGTKDCVNRESFT